MPPALLQQIPYKSTLAAIFNEDLEELRQLLCSFVVVLAQKTHEHSWHNLNKAQQKDIVKTFVYLDVLITLFRMPAQFEFAMGDLSSRFRGLPEGPLEQILQKFCKITVADKNSTFQKRTQSM